MRCLTEASDVERECGGRDGLGRWCNSTSKLTERLPRFVLSLSNTLITRNAITRSLRRGACLLIVMFKGGVHGVFVALVPI